ncbi:glycerophosphoryl diester phosphodiesterase membrane domain-containing protein [Streptomyces sp. NPDC001941]|uniref:DUF7544 domain-containing protein n=1 Tax=Streptomyces sp. NPDC001941 TaxID=3154659 RepID=UPI003324F0A9
MNDTPGWASPGSAPSDGQDSGVPRQTPPADENGSASKWSKDQPPAGQWSPPTAPGPIPPQPPAPGGWGGGPHQNDNWGRPPAAKPGVIPLRPLGVGEILDGAVSTLRAHWRTVLSVTVTVAVITQICDILIQRYLVPTVPALDPEADPSEALNQLSDTVNASLAGSVPAVLITLIATLFTTAMLTVVVSRSVLGRPVNLADAWAEARPRLPQLLGLTLLLPLMSGAIMFVALLPGLLVGSGAGTALAVLGALAALVVVVWLMVRFSLASPALMLERQSVFASMRRSAKLVHGAWWRVFGITVLTMILTFLVSMIIGIPFTIIAFILDGSGMDSLMTGSGGGFGWAFLIITGIGGVVSAAITYPINAGVSVLLYVDQRIRREALDLELARAAGLPGYGSPSGTNSAGG